MRWILLALLLFIAADVTLLYLIAKHGGEWALIGVIFVPWLFRGPLLDWARTRAATNPPDPLAALGDQLLLAASGIALFVPGVLLRVAGLLLLSRRMRARVRAIIGNKAAKVAGGSVGGMPGVNVAFTQIYAGGAEIPSPFQRHTVGTVQPSYGEPDLHNLKQAEVREVDADYTALPDGSPNNEAGSKLQ